MRGGFPGVAHCHPFEMAPFIAVFTSALNCHSTLQWVDVERLVDFFKTLRLWRPSANYVSIYSLLFIHFPLIIKSNIRVLVC